MVNTVINKGKGRDRERDKSTGKNVPGKVKHNPGDKRNGNGHK